MSKLTLLIPFKPDPERDAIARAHSRRGGDVLRLDRFWEPPPLDPATTRVYGNDTFCLVLREKLGLPLHSPSDDLLAHAPPELLGRDVELRSVAELANLDLPRFVKPVVPKQFAARSHNDAESLSSLTAGLPPETEVIVSEVITLESEFRAFFLGDELLDCACYEGSGSLDEAVRFAKIARRHFDSPRGVVLDVGYTGSRWVLVELNAAWGAGLNGCEPALVLPAILAASAPE